MRLFLSTKNVIVEVGTPPVWSVYDSSTDAGTNLGWL